MHAKRFEGEVPLPKVHKEITLDPKLFDGYVGQYQLAPNFVLTITREGDQLFAQATNQAKLPIFPEGVRDFFYKVVDAQITFVTDENGRATSLTLHQNGANLPARRVQYRRQSGDGSRGRDRRSCAHSCPAPLGGRH